MSPRVLLTNVRRIGLRLYPPVPLNNREAIKTTVLPTGGGPDGNSPMLVRKGELVVFSQYVNSRRKNIYGQDAEDFRPERWETGELAGIGWAYFPFNGGPRQCLGEDFAMMVRKVMGRRELEPRGCHMESCKLRHPFYLCSHP
jgi:cytochrome P450